MKKLPTLLCGLLLSFAAATANALVVDVRIEGFVEFNQINTGPLAGAIGGDAAAITFQVDTGVFVDSTNFPTRGYDIVAGSFTFTAGGASVGLADPLPAGVTPYFVIRNDDPAVDGFFLGTNVDGFPNGVPSDSTGLFGPFSPNFSVTYNTDPLPSLEIEDALGFYDFSGLTSFNFTVDDGPFNAMGLIFDNMTISAAPIPLPAAVWLLGAGLVSLGAFRRR
ncbi:MAG: VPLPA-CTERM sorting domain-containing protein [Pseudomonadota bacterium]